MLIKMILEGPLANGIVASRKTLSAKAALPFTRLGTETMLGFNDHTAARTNHTMINALPRNMRVHFGDVSLLVLSDLPVSALGPRNHKYHKPKACPKKPEPYQDC